MKKILLFIILFFITLNLYSFSHTIKGNNLIWSPVSDLEFIYSIYGKSSGQIIWKKYDMGKQKGETVYYGDSLIPQWSYDGEITVFTKGKIFIINSEGKTKEYESSVDDLASFDWSLKGDKIIYSDEEKIYILELKNNNNYFVIKGCSPAFIDNDKKILYFDEELKVNIIDESLKSKTIISEIVKKVYPLKNQNKFLFQIKKTIKLYDLSNSIIYVITEDKNSITGFAISYDFEFLTYNNEAGEHFIVHIPTRMKIKITEDKNFFIQKLSKSKKYSAFEKSREILILDISSYINAFNLNNIYKISFGAKDKIQPGTSLEIYQEKKNPFSNELIGYEEQNFKGLIKIMTVYEDYSFGIIDKEFSSNKKIEDGDAVLWKNKDKDKLGTVLKK